MLSKSYKTLAEQVAHEIRKRVEQGCWMEMVPGRKKLAAELGVNHKTCGAALKILETEGLLMPQGNGLGRVIVEQAFQRVSTASMRVRILAYETDDLRSHFLLELVHRLREMGHDANFSGKTLMGMWMNMERISRHVNECEADAWIVQAGPHNVLTWFDQQSFPTFALFGRPGNTSMASIIPDKAPAIEDLVSRLAQFGHQRIVLVTRSDRTRPHPVGFLECLNRLGIPASDYNYPDWGDSPDDLSKLLESLFRYTPPTALILAEAPFLFATIQWLGRMGMTAPDHVSLACMDPHPVFEWCRPEVTHIHWGTTPVINRISRWVHNVSIGKTDQRKTHANAKLILGGTIGPAQKCLKPAR